MRLSIIIPALNEAGEIRDTLGDLAGLRDAGHEIILADGGSSDETVAIATPYCDRIIHASRGRARQMNAGADVASGDVLWFLHADTRIPSNAAEIIESAIAGNAEWGRFDVRLSGKQAMLRLVGRLMNLRSCITAIATGDQGIFVKRQVFSEVGGYPEIPLMEDIALSKLLRSRGRPFCASRKLVTSSRRWEKNGIPRTILLMWWLRLSYALGANPEKLAGRYYR